MSNQAEKLRALVAEHGPADAPMDPSEVEYRQKLARIAKTEAVLRVAMAPSLTDDLITYRRLWLDLKGDPLTSAGRTTERIRRPNFGTLEIEATVSDPSAYTRPWSAKRYLKIALDTELIEDICNENERSSTHMVGK